MIQGVRDGYLRLSSTKSAKEGRLIFLSRSEVQYFAHGFVWPSSPLTNIMHRRRFLLQKWVIHLTDYDDDMLKNMSTKRCKLTEARGFFETYCKYMSNKNEYQKSFLSFRIMFIFSLQHNCNYLLYLRNIYIISSF